ncbi:RNA-binding protein (RRM domain) [Giardia duodenalis assemblage B]|uniref:RNA-binding protein (RRM domain) n=3 Tax=Giardia intestinalis TaxID=5741 RepID=A0A132NP99_GIAIN|nr:RNA binding protein, putative [Giardia intestinalis ATCC 50581]ESU45314.1 RNA-binding protein (RRM domain) [Giardia intestinalis]KWX11874.1 RNA-binding protein (RRM domain) [Giardia intestinalis assemblage B]
MADDPCKVYVGGVPTNVTEAEIEDNFKKFGRVTDVVDTKKGFFFVTFNSPDAAKLALMGDVTFDGRRCKVEIARPKKPEYTDRDKFSRPERVPFKRDYPDRRPFPSREQGDPYRPMRDDHYSRPGLRDARPQRSTEYDYPQCSFNFAVRNLPPSLLSISPFKQFILDNYGPTDYTIVSSEVDVGYFGSNSKETEDRVNEKSSINYDGCRLIIEPYKRGPGRIAHRQPRSDHFSRPQWAGRPTEDECDYPMNVQESRMNESDCAYNPSAEQMQE